MMTASKDFASEEYMRLFVTKTAWAGGDMYDN